MSDLFTYNDGASVIPADTFRISPSQISKFFDSTSEWYRTMLMDESGFMGNTATHLGNCVHAYAEMYAKWQVDLSAIDTYINSIDDPEVDKQLIRDQYPIMTQTLHDQFLVKHSFKSAISELFVVQEVMPNVVVGGSIDSYDPATATIRDWKTMGSLDKARVPKSFPRAYYFQQLIYAWALRKQGKPVNRVQLVFVTRANVGRFNDKGKPLKDYPSEVHTLTELITEENMAFIESILKLVAESVTLWKTNPEYRHILAQDWRLRQEPPRKLFV